MDTTHNIRLAVAQLTKGRFQGRAALEREAARDSVALARLEDRLGIPGPGEAFTQYERDYLKPRAACHRARTALDQATRIQARARAHMDLVEVARSAATEAWAKMPFEMPEAAPEAPWPRRLELPSTEESRAALRAASQADFAAWQEEHTAWRERADARQERNNYRSARVQATAYAAAYKGPLAKCTASEAENRLFRANQTLAAAHAEYTQARARLQAYRAARKPAPPPAPLRILHEQTKRAAVRALRRASLRTATHDHDNVIVIVAKGSEGASSSSDRVRPSSVGLPNAYAKKGFFVVSSTHEWRVSVEHGLRVIGGFVYLRPDLRVRSGRGTALVTEKLTAVRGGLAWRAT